MNRFRVFFLALLSVVFSTPVFAGSAGDALWTEYAEKLLRDIPKRGCNSKKDQEMFHREQGVVPPKLSETFRIEWGGEKPSPVLFLAGESGYVVLKGVLNRTGLRGDMIPFHYLLGDIYFCFYT